VAELRLRFPAVRAPSSTHANHRHHNRPEYLAAVGLFNRLHFAGTDDVPLVFTPHCGR